MGRDHLKECFRHQPRFPAPDDSANCSVIYLWGFKVTITFAPGAAFRMPRKRRHLIFAVSFVVLLVFLLTEFRLAVVHGDSMLPTYQNGQMVLVNRLASSGNKLKHGDVVLVRSNNE